MVSAVAPLAVEEPRIISTAQQPVRPTITPMPEHRVAAFRTSVAARLREGVAVAQLVREQEALAVALASPNFLGTLAASYSAEMAELEPNKEYAVTPESALIDINAILKNRILDAQRFARLLQDPAFVAEAQAEAQQPAPEAKHYELPAVKAEEVIRRLVQPNDQDGAEPPPHVTAGAIGHRLVHQALANAFRPKNENIVLAKLEQELGLAWPEAKAGEIQALATGWMKARHDPAHSVADGLAPNGALYKEALRRAQELQAEKLQAASAAPAPAATPAATVQTPTAPTLKLAAQPDLMMDRL